MQIQIGMWKIEDFAIAQLADRKTTASQSNRQTEYRNMSSQACNTQLEQDKYNDVQVSLIIQSYRANVPRVLINGVSMLPKEALKNVSVIQMEQIIALLVGEEGMDKVDAKGVIEYVRLR